MHRCTLVLSGGLSLVVPKYDYRPLTFGNQMEPESPTPLPSRNPDYPLSRTCQLTVLIVDDDASVRRALKMQLSVESFNIHVFGSAEELLTASFPKFNRCLLLDVYMPPMGGMELWKHLAAIERALN
jgi:PleD family two-component response regulator